MNDTLLSTVAGLALTGLHPKNEMPPADKPGYPVGAGPPGAGRRHP